MQKLHQNCLCGFGNNLRAPLKMKRRWENAPYSKVEAGRHAAGRGGWATQMPRRCASVTGLRRPPTGEDVTLPPASLDGSGCLGEEGAHRGKD